MGTTQLEEYALISRRLICVVDVNGGSGRHSVPACLFLFLFFWEKNGNIANESCGFVIKSLIFL